MSFYLEFQNFIIKIRAAVSNKVNFLLENPREIPYNRVSLNIGNHLHERSYFFYYSTEKCHLGHPLDGPCYRNRDLFDHTA